MQIIRDSSYKLCGLDNEYRITSFENVLLYKLELVENNIATTIKTVIVQPNSEVAVLLSGEGKYLLTIYYALDGADEFSLRYFSTLKTRILDLMKSMICDCTTLDNNILNCTNTATSPVAQDLYDAQLLFASTGLYRDYLLSPDLLRPYNCCFTMVLDDNGYTLDSLLSDSFQSIVNDGVTPNSTRLLRLYTAYLYILYYTIDKDAAICGSGSGVLPPPKDPVKAPAEAFDKTDEVDTLFEPERISDCMSELGLDFNEIQTTFETCYLDKNVGLCTIIENAIATPTQDSEIINLTYVSYESVVEVGSTVSPTTFSWEILEGTPVNLKLDDGGDGNINHQSVSGTSYNTAETYSFATRKSVKWILKGDNTNAIAMSTQWVFPIYTGKSVTGGFPNEATILAGTKHITDGSIGFSHDPATSDVQYGWIAVPKESSTQPYTKWDVDDTDLNEGAIGVENETGWEEEFIAVAANPVSVSGNDYYVYVYNYPSQIDDTLTLSKTK